MHVYLKHRNKVFGFSVFFCENNNVACQHLGPQARYWRKNLSKSCKQARDSYGNRFGG
jgi:hypothetical protein